MDRYRALITCGCISLLVGAAAVPARAIDVTVPGVSVGVGTSGNGASATVGAGGAGAGATVGGSGAGVNATVGGSGVSIDAIIGTGEDGAPNTADDAAGGLLDTDAEVLAAFGKLSPEDQELLTRRCSTVLGSPGSFDDDLVALCEAITRLDP